MRSRLLLAFALASVSSVAAAAGHLSLLDEGLHAMVAGDYPLAVERLRLAVNQRPRDPIARFNLGSALRGAGRPSEAIYELRQAFDLSADEPGRANALYGIALSADQLADPNAAAQAWKDYIGYAQSFRSEQPAVAVARMRLAENQRLAHVQTVPGTQKAGR
jgi:tetratricopeptide (TPR) repeat protein